MALSVDDFKKNMKKVLFEFVGTMVLLLTIQLAFGAKESSAALAVGLVVAALVYAGGPISGGHINPAVTLAMYLRDSIDFQGMLMYWIAQFAGGFCGALLGRIIGGVGVFPAIGETHNFMQAFLAELVFTAVFILVILLVVPKSGTPGPYYGAVIGITLYAGITCIASVSGASMNPAVALSLVLVKKVSKLHYALWVALANAVGGVVGTILFYFLDSDEDSDKPESILRDIRDRLVHPKMGGAGEGDPLLASTT